MKKTFLNVALLSLLTMSASSVFTACSDDDWKDGVNKVEGEVNATSDLIKQMDAQIKALDAALKQAQSDADAAKKAADDALDAAKKAAEEGNQELAALKAEVAENKLAAEAAAKAQAEALEALKAQLEALKVLVETNSQLIEENKNAIGGINTRLDGNTESINQLLGDVENINSVIAQLQNQLGDINVADLKTALDNLSGTVAGLQAAITTIQGQIAAIDAKLATIDMDVINDKFGTLETNLANEIADRQAADAALQQQIDELRSQLEALNIGTNLAEFAEFVQATETQLAALEEFKTNALERLSGLEGKVEGIETTLSGYETRISTLESELTAAKKTAADALALAQANALLISTMQGQIGNLDTLTQTLQASLAAAEENIGDLKEELNKIAARISEVNDSLCTLLYGELRSLVFVPQAYVNGIESALYYYMNYNALDGDTKAQADPVMTIGDTKYTVVSGKQMWNFAQSDKIVTVNPYSIVQYHMNPTSANAPFEALSFVSNDAEIISRASKATIVTDKEGYKVEDGVLSVGLKADAAKVDEASGKMPVFALRANVAKVGPEGEEQTVVVTSDYAMLQPMNIVPSCLAYNDKDIPGLMPSRVPGGAELYADLANAFGSLPSFEVAWDNNTTTLSDYIQIVYKDEKTNTYRTWESAEEWEHFGLSLSFETIDYTMGDNTVSESAWCTVDAQTGLFMPCGVTNDGKPSGQNDRNSLGKLPVVRVTVMESGNIVLVGYIKVKIVPTVKYYVTDTFTFNAVDFSCETKNAGVQNENILAEILKVTGLSEDNFYANYHWAEQPSATEDGLNVLTQYVYNSAAKDYVVVADGLGDLVAQNLSTLTGDANIREINFDWWLDTFDQQMMYINPNHAGSTVVCLVSDNADIFPPVYVPVAGSINAKAVGTVGTKMEARWFRSLSTALLNVKQPTDGEQPTTITANLDQLWTVSATGKNQPVITWLTGAPKFEPSLYAEEYGKNGGYKYYFSAENNRTISGTTSENKVYKIEFSVEKKAAMSLLGNDVPVSNMGDHALMVDLNGMDTKYGEYENTVLYANGEELAEINPETGVITLADNDTARELLNTFASNGDGLNRTNALLEAKIGIVAYNECGIALKLDNASVFPAVFLRPINIDKDKVGIFTDATANGSLVDVFSLLFFDDWRGVKFNGNNGWLFAYYNVKSAVPDFSRMTTNAATVETAPNSFTNEPTITAAFSLVDDEEIEYDNISESNSANILNAVKAGFGKIKYDNTNVNVNSFKVRIPFTITYGMGEFEIWIECDVNSTMGA